MRKLVIAAAASAVLLGAAAPAFAVEQIEGTVISANPATGTLTLQSGQTFTFANGAVLYGLMPGQVVGVTYNGTQGIGAFNPHPQSDDNNVSF